MLLQEIFPALGSDWQEVSKKRRDAVASGGTSSNTVWGKPTTAPAKAPSSNPPASSDPPTTQPPRQPMTNGRSSRPLSANGSVHGEQELQPDPSALATGAFDAPKKDRRRPDSAEHYSTDSGGASAANGFAAAPSSSKPANDVGTGKYGNTCQMLFTGLISLADQHQ